MSREDEWLDAIDLTRKQEAEIAALRAALEQLIRDYEDETGEKAMAARRALERASNC
jgi:hypothetical protein